jgi:uncharacterized protein YndB with AHSA1/START domain
MTIAPITADVTVAVPPARAFALFTAHFGRWWPKSHAIGAAPPETLVIEPRTGGRWFERSADGVETPWGRVLAWEPPRRVLLTWQIGADWTYDPALLTEVEARFDPVAGGTRVRLKHRDLERFGPSAAAHADQLRSGWPSMLGLYAGYAAAEPARPTA